MKTRKRGSRRQGRRRGPGKRPVPNKPLQCFQRLAGIVWQFNSFRPPGTPRPSSFGLPPIRKRLMRNKVGFTLFGNFYSFRERPEGRNRRHLEGGCVAPKAEVISPGCPAKVCRGALGFQLEPPGNWNIQLRKTHRPERLRRDGLNQNVQNQNRAAKPTPMTPLPRTVFSRQGDPCTASLYMALKACSRAG